MLYTLTHKDKHSRARTGVLSTAHGKVETPIFMPVGTKATVKTLSPEDIEAVGSQIILANTYHLHLRPGSPLIADFGGVHEFMRWDKPMLTDSGGFQVFSLGAQKKEKEVRGQGKDNGSLVSIDEDGVDFRSHIDGSKHRFTPEIAMDIQHEIGADIIMAFDECTPDNASHEDAVKAMERTHRWAERCVDRHKQWEADKVAGKEDLLIRYPQYLFGIIQGGKHKDLRIASTKAITSMDFDGIAIGGESIGYNMEATKDILDWIMPFIPEHKARYTMGVGFSPFDLFDVVAAGVDMFDCVAPTRMARNGALYVHPATYRELVGKSSEGNQRRCWVDISNGVFREDHAALDPRMPGSPIAQYSRAYLHHLFREREMLGHRLATMHNLWFLLDLMREMREAIREDRFLALKEEWERAFF